jgi:hypothetical protein
MKSLYRFHICLSPYHIPNISTNIHETSYGAQAHIGGLNSLLTFLPSASIICTVAKQRLSKNISSATNTHAIESLSMTFAELTVSHGREVGYYFLHVLFCYVSCLLICVDRLETARMRAVMFLSYPSIKISIQISARGMKLHVSFTWCVVFKKLNQLPRDIELYLQHDIWRDVMRTSTQMA